MTQNIESGNTHSHVNVVTYNDLSEGELIMKDEENSEDEEQGEWVAKYVFIV